MQTKTYTTEAGAKKAVARAYSPTIVRCYQTAAIPGSRLGILFHRVRA
jgi:hypothetical protein